MPEVSLKNKLVMVAIYDLHLQRTAPCPAHDEPSPSQLTLLPSHHPILLITRLAHYPSPHPLIPHLPSLLSPHIFCSPLSDRAESILHKHFTHSCHARSYFLIALFKKKHSVHSVPRPGGLEKSSDRLIVLSRPFSKASQNASSTLASSYPVDSIASHYLVYLICSQSPLHVSHSVIITKACTDIRDVKLMLPSTSSGSTFAS